MSENGTFRAKRNGFTIVQNMITRDDSISLKAKGLYLVIQSYITMPDMSWTKKDFIKKSGEGEKAFNRAWNELKDKGYLKVYSILKGNKYSVEYELLDEPKEGPHTFYYNNKGELIRTNLDWENKTDSPECEKESDGSDAVQDIVVNDNTETKSRTPYSGTLLKGALLEGDVLTGTLPEGPVSEGVVSNGGGKSNINNKNTMITHNIYSFNQSNKESESNGTNVDNSDSGDSEFPGWEPWTVDEKNFYVERIRTNIGYDWRAKHESSENFEIFHKIYVALINFVCNPPKTFYVHLLNKDRPYDEVRNRLIEIKFNQMSEARKRIMSTKSIMSFESYALAVLFSVSEIPEALLEKQESKKSQFCQFEQRDYDFDSFESDWQRSSRKGW